MAKLDLSSLSKALESLSKAVERSQREPDDEEVRDAVIQRFEYSYDLCWKMLKRAIERDSAVPAEVDQMSFRDLTSHTYDRAKTVSVD